jgi:hypothetical protein
MAGTRRFDAFVIASGAKQSSFAKTIKLDCFVRFAPRNDESELVYPPLGMG